MPMPPMSISMPRRSGSISLVLKIPVRNRGRRLKAGRPLRVASRPLLFSRLNNNGLEATRRGRPALSRRPRFLTGIFNTSEIDPERRGMLMLIGGIGILVVFALALITYGYYNESIKPRGETVFSVGGREYNYAYLEKRVDADIASGEFSVSDIQTSVANTVLKIQNEEL